MTDARRPPPSFIKSLVSAKVRFDVTDARLEPRSQTPQAVRVSNGKGSAPNASTAAMRSRHPATFWRLVADTLNRLHYFERAAETNVRVLSNGEPVKVSPPEVAELTARQWDSYAGFAENHLTAILQILDREQPEFGA